MISRNIAVSVTVKDRTGASSTRQVNVLEQVPLPVVMGGYYVSGNGNMTADVNGMNLKSFTQYHSFADGIMIPGLNNDYLRTFGTRGILGNYVCEFKHYGNSNTGAQTFTLEGIRYTVPAPNMLIQKRSGTTFPKAYGYEQIWTGQCDGLLHKLLIQIRNMGGVPINIQLASEFDTDHEFGTTENNIGYTWAQADARAVRALNYVLDYFRSRLLPANTTFTIGMGGFDRPSWTRMHPEDLMAKVDFLQWNAYRRSAGQSAYDVFKRTKVWSDADLGPIAKSKHIMIAEWGTPMSLGDQATWIKTVPAAIKRLNEESTTGYYVMTNYFNSNDGWATLNPKAAGLDALKAIYSQNPYT